jgi:uncharacterized membrane protein
MDRQLILFLIGMLILVFGLYLRLTGNVEDGMACVTVALYLTIVWLIDASFRLKKQVQELKKEVDEMKNRSR